MTFSGKDELREQLKRYGDLALSVTKMNRHDLEATIREAFLAKGSTKGRSADLLEVIRSRSQKGREFVNDHVRAEFRHEFDEVAKRGRAELAQLIERLVCVIEDRFGSSAMTTQYRGTRARDHSEEAAWRASHAPESVNHAPAPHATPPEKAPAKKAPAKKAAAKKSSPKKSAVKRAPTKKDPDVTPPDASSSDSSS